MSRQPILSVLGHVNAGKTSFLDAIRESKITEGESGQITQMIGATEIPLHTLEETCGDLLKQLDTDITIPGIMFIDTPGHAAFSSLRKRGGSISDIAILMIDIQEGIQPQTEEAIKILKQSNTPFIIGLNKIDLMNGWNTDRKLFTQAITEQPDHLQEKLDNRIYELMGELNEYDIVADRFDRIDDFQEKVTMVPMSAETGLGIPELLMVVTGLSQNYLEDELDTEEGVGKATVLEVSEKKGMGKTTDVILYDGVINEEDIIVYGTADGVKETTARALLEPRPLTEIREDKEYTEVKKVEPAAGVKISAKDLKGVIPGAPIRAAKKTDKDLAREQVLEELQTKEFETEIRGIVVKADSLGSLEALMMELEERNIRVQKTEVGNINKNDIVKASDEKDEEKVVFAFNTGITDQAEQLRKDRGVKIFQSDVIYEIIDGYREWRQDLEQKKRQEKLEDTTRPAKIRLMPDHVFRSSNPAVAGTAVTKGIIKPGASLMKPDGEKIGTVKSIQEQNESIEKAGKGKEIATSISNATIGRNIEEGDTLLTDITSEDYNKLKELEDLLTQGEKQVLEEIVDIKDEQNPHWKLG